MDITSKMKEFIRNLQCDCWEAITEFELSGELDNELCVAIG